MLFLSLCILVGGFTSTPAVLAQHNVNESNLRDLLTKAEWSALFGTVDLTPSFAVVHPRLPDARRKRRSTSRHHLETLVLEADALGRRFELTLRQSRALLDPNFVMLGRWENRSEVLPANLADDSCYYQSEGNDGERAAVGICGGMRGIIASPNNDMFMIHPLPQRFHQRSSSIPHVIVKRQAVDNLDSLPAFRLRNQPSYPQFNTRTPSQVLDTESKCASALQFNPNQLFDYRRGTNFSVGEEEFTARDGRQRRKRLIEITAPSSVPVHVETAVFIDRDLFQHMTVNFPTETERELVRVVLAMINAVQLLYHDPSLGRQVNFVLKRLEILHVDPSSLQRPHDIDRFLSSFCLWQRDENPADDTDPLHWDHALILTGLDLYVVSKGGKVSSQVVGLAPVAGMCTPTSSCTVNEGRHFESVYVVAHEIGHNLGMRHDGPLADNECDPGSYIMSPTLGSGKITWSSCSQKYLQMFLDAPQSRCLLDHSTSSGQLDHSAEGTLPGERFDANQQCMLKYGRGSAHSTKQELYDVCRDLHCQRERYTWTSHPALEGTLCGTDKWCRSGRCVGRGLSALQAGFSANQRVDGGWSDWSVFSDCASGCLYDNEGRLEGGSTGIMIASRRCNNPRAENGGQACQGKDMRYQACEAVQCGNVQRTTIRDFADQICARASKIDTEVLGTGLQRISSDPEEACTVWCYKRNGGSKSRGWTFPDGTSCQSRRSRYGKPTFCIAGRCEEFVCDRYDAAIFANLPDSCPRVAGRLRVRDSSLFRLKGGRRHVIPGVRAWAPSSGCHFNCLAPGKGLRLVVAKDKQCWGDPDCKANSVSSIQLCQPDKLGCGRLKTPFEHATAVCSKYRERVRRLSGIGMQISPSKLDPDRPCRVACQDDTVNHRFYLVNGEDGWFPFGADCSRGVADKKAFCVSGKCLEFALDDTPVQDAEYTLPLLIRPKRGVSSPKRVTRLDQSTLDMIIARLPFTGFPKEQVIRKENLSSIDFDNPIDLKEKTESMGPTQLSNTVLAEENVYV